MPERIDLKSVREAKGITIDKVFEDTKIPKRVIVALETGDFSDLFLNQVYVKGFAKSYARYLGLDPKEVLRDVFPEECTEVKPEIKKGNEPSATKKNYGVEQVLGVIRDWLIFLFSLLVSLFVKIPKRVYMGIAIVLLGIFLVLSVFHKQVSNEMDDVTGVSQSERSIDNNEGSAVVSKGGVSERDVSEEGKGAVPMSKEKFSIFVQANDDCWMRVKSDGEELFVGVLRRGDIENWSAKNEISLWVGNAGALKIRCDGKVYDKIGRKGQVIKNIVFSPDCSYHIRRR